MVLRGGKELDTYLRNLKRAVPVPFDELQGGLPNIGVCDDQIQAPILPRRAAGLIPWAVRSPPVAAQVRSGAPVYPPVVAATPFVASAPIVAATPFFRITLAHISSQ